jgi:hypothetical protein
MMTVTVVDEVGVGVADVTLWKGSTQNDEMTDSQGIVMISAPLVSVDRTCYISADKYGYNYAQDTVTVRKKKQSHQVLFSIPG